jgi:acetyl-CoA C-acetyltransferase
VIDDPTTPVIVGVGEVSERLDEPGYRGLSAVELGAGAATLAVADAGLTPEDLDRLDLVVGIRQFETSHPLALAALGRSDNYPRSVTDRLGVDPVTAVYDVVGGDGPQRLVGEVGARIAEGEIDSVLLVGSEAMSTARHFAGRDDAPDHSEERGGQLDDRGYGIDDMITPSAVAHRVYGPPAHYALLEHARRARRGLSREAYAPTMGGLFAPMSEVAATNPHSAAPTRRSATELVEVTEQNRLVADPYPRFLVARDQVNQGAAVLMMSVARARELGVAQDKWVFVHGHAKAADAPVLNRADLGVSAATEAALHGALASAGIGIDDVDVMDLYSCFPVAVFVATDSLGLAADDPRGLTVTGGLPYFGGAGNNYAMHAIAEVAHRLRAQPGSIGLVAANGGIISKYAAGVYSTTPTPWPVGADAQPAVDAAPRLESVDEFAGEAVVETFTVTPYRGAMVGILVCRTDDGRRFYANADPADEEFAEVLATGEPIGVRVAVRTVEGRNTATRC